MNATNHQPELPAIGTPAPGGFFAGAFLLNGERRALIVAPKDAGELSGIWHPNAIDVPGAKSYVDGMANTQAMAESGSPIARHVLTLSIDGLNDFYIPSQDELEICYRAFKPTAETNYCWARSGINLSALPPAYPYTPDFPIQTALGAFSEGGIDAFAQEAYWTSTQHASVSGRAWCQGFDNGSQDYDGKDS